MVTAPWRLESRTRRTDWEVNPTFGTFETVKDGEQELNAWLLEVWRLGFPPMGRAFRLVHRHSGATADLYSDVNVTSAVGVDDK